MQRDLNKEAFLWYTMTSPEYLDRAHAKLTEAADYLRARIREHESITDYPPVAHWLGEMEKLESSYANARAMLEHGEQSAMDDWAGSLMNIPRGFAESSMDWMPMDQAAHFRKTLDRAYGIAAAYMDATTMSGLHCDDPDGDWRVDKDYGFPGADISLYWEDFEDVTTELPIYEVDEALSCRTGELVPWTGVWIPAGSPGTAALAFARQGQIMQPAYEVFLSKDDPEFEETRPVDVTWHPFRPTGRTLSVNDGGTGGGPLRVPAGKSATQSGYWFTPAREGSRRYFKLDETFPHIEGSSYGATFWQWSPDQSNPSLR